MALDQDNLRRKNDELTRAYKDKNRKLLQAQELYDKLKRKAMLGQIQDAASDAVDTTLQAGGNMGAHSTDRIDTQEGYEQQYGTPMHPAHYTERHDRSGVMPLQPRMGAQDLREGGWARPQLPQGEWAHGRDGMQCSNCAAANMNIPTNLPVTPSTHRQRPGTDGLGLSAVPGLVSGTPVALHGSGRMRQPSREIQHNQRAATDNLVGVGLTSRIKASQASGPAGAFVPAARLRGKL